MTKTFTKEELTERVKKYMRARRSLYPEEDDWLCDLGRIYAFVCELFDEEKTKE